MVKWVHVQATILCVPSPTSISLSANTPADPVTKTPMASSSTRLRARRSSVPRDPVISLGLAMLLLWSLRGGGASGKEQKETNRRAFEDKKQKFQKGERCGAQDDEQLPGNAQTGLVCPVWAAFFSFPALWIAGPRPGMVWHQAAACSAEEEHDEQTRQELRRPRP